METITLRISQKRQAYRYNTRKEDKMEELGHQQELEVNSQEETSTFLRFFPKLSTASTKVSDFFIKHT